MNLSFCCGSTTSGQRGSILEGSPSEMEIETSLVPAGTFCEGKHSANAEAAITVRHRSRSNNESIHMKVKARNFGESRGHHNLPLQNQSKSNPESAIYIAENFAAVDFLLDHHPLSSSD
eukprot:CAMPEP_0202961682 /NCGR_PEP_ID=MMETSP1396-20130829/5752_1 /ASSEMBLY_ACC=CAM_ASM_000872 /TAXON_ID= /ORGANISM="Pseudokeronopsis sp., Strain Brazil" /LENGTH=118 /DNA_ID=CAMNT_0049681689 /DNA_START=148 /DNA_END=504 /DNA_ORIENTATION=-